MTLSKAVWLCAAWVMAAILFNVGIFFWQGQEKATEFLTGYLIEWSLSVDNLFVFFLIFSHFKIDSGSQGRILSWGVLGAQVMRAIFIMAGVLLLRKFNWVIYVFGAVLVFSGVKLFFKNDKPQDLDQDVLLRSLKRFIPVGLSTFLIVLIVVELADLIFALDSIPAVLAITKDPFIVYSSNIFAILGLRSMYFVLSPFFNRFHYLHYALGVILVFVGVKMLTDHWWHIPVINALVFMVLVLSIFALVGLRQGPQNLKETV